MERKEIKLTILKPEEGKYLYNGEVFSTEVYLGITDYEKNWKEITEEEKNEIESEKEDEIHIYR